MLKAVTSPSYHMTCLGQKTATQRPTQESSQKEEILADARMLHMDAVKQVELVPSAKKKKKKDEFVEEYFILLNSKHLVHFQPTTGFVDPFKKTISGKAIDLLHSSVKMSEVEGGEAGAEARGGAEAELNQFEITTGRYLYLLKPKDGESSAAGWVEKITETMLAVEEGGTDHVHNAADRDYGAALQGYSNVKPDDVRT